MKEWGSPLRLYNPKKWDIFSKVKNHEVIIKRISLSYGRSEFIQSRKSLSGSLTPFPKPVTASSDWKGSRMNSLFA